MRDITVLVPEDGPRLASAELELQGIVEVGETTQVLLTRGRLEPGDTFTLDLTELPRFAAIGNRSVWLDSAFRYAGLVLLAIMMGAVGAYAIVIKRKRLAPVGVAADLGDLGREREALVVSLAGLDAARDDGNISDDEYGRLRRAQRNRLTDVLMLISEHSGE